jgi:hypothetical protein
MEWMTEGEEQWCNWQWQVLMNKVPAQHRQKMLASFVADFDVTQLEKSADPSKKANKRVWDSSWAWLAKCKVSWKAGLLFSKNGKPHRNREKKSLSWSSQTSSLTLSLSMVILSGPFTVIPRAGSWPDNPARPRASAQLS